MAAALHLIRRCQLAGLRLVLEGDHLKVNAPKGALTPDLVANLRDAKPDLLRLPAVNDAGSDDMREATAEHTAILEYDGGLSTPEVERIAKLAKAFYAHIIGPGKVQTCCYAPSGRYCTEGHRLRDAYYRPMS